jgi:hypothetical protein
MPWYKTGTVSVTLNSNAVIGAGTSFIANSRVGDAFRGPDGGWYEVTNIASDTALSISPNYQGSTNSSGVYALAPMQGYVKDSADALRALVNTYGTKLAALGTTGNYDILPVIKGGTGGATQADARTGLGLGNASIATVVTSNTDSTAGRLLTVGYCGLGSPSAVVNIDSSLHSGIYQAASTGGGTYPAGFSNGSVIVAERNASPYRGNQILISDADGRMWRRANSGTWTAWERLLSNEHILGTVSQSSGIPTGAIIERGSNANGEYVKFADGTMICTLKANGSDQAVTGSTGSMFQAGSELSWTYPMPFVAAPSISSTVSRNDASLVMGCYHRTVSATVTLWRIWASIAISAGNVKDVYLKATGRWF